MSRTKKDVLRSGSVAALATWVFICVAETTVAVAADTAAPRHAANAAPAADEKSNLETVLVTARKHEESLQEVPLSIVAVSGEQLERRSIGNLAHLAQSTPNFTFSEQPQGGRVAGIAFIRGVGQRDAHSAYDPAVGIYLDGVYMGRMYANNLDMLDLERVEILRGPQGTLFGKNTSGGAVNIVTKRPDASAVATGGRIQMTGGSRDRFDATGSVNVPLVADRLSLQVSGARLTRDGYGVRVDGQEMANTDRTSARTQVLFKATEDFSALLSGDWMEFDEKNAAFKLINTNPSIAPLVALNTTTTQRYDNRWLSPRDFAYNGTGPNSARGTVRGASLTLTYDSPWGALKSISAYRDMNTHNDLDPDGSPVVVLDQFQAIDQDQFSQELQATGNAFGERLNWILGAYYFHESVDDTTSYNILTALLGQSASFTRVNRIENDSVAVFGQGIYSITEKLLFTAGLRYTEDEKNINATQFGFPSGVLQFSVPPLEHRSDAVSPRLGLDYKWTPGIMTYVSAAQGTKSGGFNGRGSRVTDFTEFDDEVVWTYELGLRSQRSDGRLRFNATAFYSAYSDLQTQINGSTVVNGAPTPFNVVTNIPEAQIKGGEVELIVVPAAGLTLTGGLGLTYAEYTELPTDSRFVSYGAVTKNSQLPNAPEVTYTLAAEYTVAMTDALNLTTNIDYTHRSKTYFNPENSPNLIQPAYGLLNARLTFEHAPSDVSISLFGTNLTDEIYFVGGFDDATSPSPGLGFTIINQAAPRELGISAQVRF